MSLHIFGGTVMKENNISKKTLSIKDNQISNEDITEVNELFEKLSKNANVLYNFVLAYTDYINTKRDYGTNEELSMMEAHVLTDISDNPGITVTELSKTWDRTTSAISQTVRKLIKKDLVYRINSKEDAKIFFLYPSEKAKAFSVAHKKYDNINIVETNKHLLKKFTMEDLCIFHNIMDEYTKLLKQNKHK